MGAWTKRPIVQTGCLADFYVDGTIVASSNNGATTGWIATQGKGTFVTGESGYIALSVKTTCPGTRVGDVCEFFLDDVSITPI